MYGAVAVTLLISVVGMLLDNHRMTELWICAKDQGKRSGREMELMEGGGEGREGLEGR